MRFQWAGLAVVLALCAFLGFRVARLEQRVAGIGKQLGVPAAAAGTSGAGAQPARGDHEQRLGALERDAKALRDDVQTLEKATGERSEASALDAPGGDQRILSVIGREMNRIRDAQLQFHRERWYEWRQGALDNFAQAQRLSPVQTERLDRLLTAEIETLVALLKRPDVHENPDRAARDWLAVLEQTDREARAVLDPAQSSAWDSARAIERDVFWPWLPKQ